MAKRPVYLAKETGKSYIETLEIEFEWFPGFSVSQKQKSIESLHTSFKAECNNKKILEISSKSMDELGVNLSAFNLMIRTKEIEFSLECAFQGSKVFENGGPYTEVFKMNSREAKRYDKLKTSGDLKKFQFFNVEWEPEPKTLFYDWLYINAVHSNKELANQLINYDAFTDIEFNPKKSLNSQCKAAALYVSLYRRGDLDIIFNEKQKAKRIEKYKKIISKYQKIKFVEDQLKLH